MGICESKTPGRHVCIVADNSVLPIGSAILLCQPLELCHLAFHLAGRKRRGPDTFDATSAPFPWSQTQPYTAFRGLCFFSEIRNYVGLCGSITYSPQTTRPQVCRGTQRLASDKPVTHTDMESSTRRTDAERQRQLELRKKIQALQAQLAPLSPGEVDHLHSPKRKQIEPTLLAPSTPSPSEQTPCC